MFYLDKLQRNISLAFYTTFKIGGKAKFFYIAKSNNDLIKAVNKAKKSRVHFFILGNGSNILVSDKGFDGLVIKISAKGGPASGWQNTKIVAETGTSLGRLVGKSIKSGLTGLEWAVGIPGTLGGAIRGNAGAFSGSMAEIVKTIKVFDAKNQKIRILKNKDCKFGYRDSIFKRNKNLIILSAELELKKGDKEKSQKLIKEYLKQRKEKQAIEYPSAGCVFKNFTPHRICSGVGPKGFSAGYSIEQCGLKGKKINEAMISKKHANFIVNLGGAKARDVKKLINLCKEKVKDKFGIKLEEEIEYVGF